MLPRFRSDVTYYELDDGVAFFHHGKWSKINGSKIFSALQSLTPQLDGRRSVTQLTQGMNADQSTRLKQLIALLGQHDIITDASLDLPHDLPATVLNTYGAEIAFLDGNYGSGAAHFSTFRKQQILLLGDPEFQSKIAASLASLGASRVAVYPPLPPEQFGEVYRQRRDDDFTLQGVQDAEYMRAIEEADVIVLTAHFEPMYLWAQLGDSEKRVLRVVIHDDAVWIGTLDQRSHSDFPTQQLSDHIQSEPYPFRGQFWSEQTAAYVASLVAFQVFSSPGSPNELRPALKVNLETFETEPLDAKQGKSSPLDAQLHLQQLEQHPPITRTTVARNVLQLIGTHRPISSFGEANLVQLPLHIITATLCDGRRVVGYGLRANEARYEAALRALESLSQAPVGTPGVHPVSLQNIDFIGHEALATASGFSWQQAVDQSLLQIAMHCCYTAHHTYEDAREPQDADANCLRGILAAFDQAAEVKWVSNPFHLPMCEIKLSGQTMGLCISPSAPTAYRQAMLEAVARCQLATLNLPQLQFPLGTAAIDQLDWPHVDRSQLITALQETGWEVGLRPPLQDSRLNTVLPFVAQTFARRVSHLRGE